jgi:cytochrome P450
LSEGELGMSVQTESVTAPPAAPTRLREIDDLPAPPGLPLLGNVLQFERARMHQQVERWVREYGPYFSFRIGRRRILVVADHAAMGTLMRDRPDGFRRTKRLAEITAEIGSSAVGVFGAEGEVWKRQRRMVMAGFDPRHLRAYFPSLVKVSERSPDAGSAADTGASIDLQGDLMRYTVDTVSGLAFGAEVNTLESDDDVIQRHLDKIFPAIFRRIMAALPTWRWWKSAADRELDESVAAISRAIQDFVAAARKRLEDPERRAAPENLLEAMIVAADDPQSGITPGEIHGNVLTMLLAGEDTTANTLAIWLLYRHPECPARARRGRRARRRPGELTIERLRKTRLRRGAPTRRCACARRFLPHAAGAARDERRPHPRSDRHPDLGGPAQREPQRGVLRRGRSFQARALARQRRSAERHVREPGRDAVRRGAARLPRAAPGDAGDQDGPRRPARPLRHRERRPRGRRHRAARGARLHDVARAADAPPAAARLIAQTAAASAASACSQSAIRSSTSSRPTAKRTTKPRQRGRARIAFGS